MTLAWRQQPRSRGSAAAATPPGPGPRTSSSTGDGTPARVTRRHAAAGLLLATASAAAAAALPPPASAAPAAVAGPAAPSAPAAAGYYADARQAYALAPPAGWELKKKAGADALWEDPARRSSSLGVTVAPVRVASLASFGPLAAVGERLLGAERAKDSTLSVTMLSQAERVSGGGGASGAGASGETAAAAVGAPARAPAAAAAAAPPAAAVRYYCYEYDLDSTRGRKRILNVVTIAGSRLYIVNGQVKCGKAVAAEAAGDDGAPPLVTAATCELDGAAAAALAALRLAAASFEVVLGPGA